MDFLRGEVYVEVKNKIDYQYLILKELIEKLIFR